MAAEQQIVLRVAPDGSVQAETRGLKGARCLDTLALLESMLEAQTVSSAFTHEYHEQVAPHVAHEEVGTADELYRQQ